MDASDINHGGAFVPDEDVYQGEGDWADAEAWRIANTDEADDIMQEIIAAALRAAERRGLERAADENARLRVLLQQAHPHVCSLLCPSVWKAGHRPPESDLCQAIQKALDAR